MKTISLNLFAFSLLVSACLALAEDIANVDQLFLKTSAAAESAEQASATLLAPASYRKGQKSFRAAKSRREKGRSDAIITESLEQSLEAFSQAILTAELAKKFLANAILARNDALTAEANIHAKASWDKGEKLFTTAVAKLESSKKAAAQKKATSAESVFRSAELSAIKTNYLEGARDLIAKADKEKVKRYAPLTLENARQLLGKAESELNQNRYDTDLPRTLAKQAKTEAGHAIYLMQEFKRVKQGEISQEELALNGERPLTQIAEVLDVAVELDNGSDAPTNKIVSAIEQLIANSEELVLLKQEYAALASENHELNQRLGVQSSRLKRQEEIKRKMALVEAMFAFNEALVYRQGNNVLIRMVGLNFGSGEATIDSANFSLLRKVIEALRQFPAATLTVEGHTDSFGSDATNLRLSQTRADAVVEYLRANMDSDALAAIESLGYGEARPVANNETAAGRKKNRRIDLLIKPSY